MYEDQKTSFFQKTKKPLIIACICVCILGGFLWVTQKNPSSSVGKVVKNIRSFNPFNSNSGSSTFSENTISNTDQEQKEVPTPVIFKKTGLRKLVLANVAGFVLLSKTVLVENPTEKEESVNPLKEIDSFVDSIYKNQPTTRLPATLPNKKQNTIKKVFVRYADKKTGFIYDIPLTPEKEDDLIPTQITASSVPSIEEAYFSIDGKTVFIRYSDDSEQIQTLRAKINEDAKSLENTQFLDTNITSFTLTPSRQKAFGLKKTPTGSELYEYTFSGIRKKVIQFPFSDFSLQSINEKDIILSTLPSGYIAGYIYQFDTISGVRKKILSSISGVRALVHPNQKNSIYSRGDTSSTKLFMYSQNSGSGFETKLSSFVDKCTWNIRTITAYCASPQNLPETVYPDTWYKGLVNTRDTLYRIDTAGGQNELLRASDISGQNLDMINLSFDPDEKNLFFINKYDSSLWIYDFSE
jgi:hypothetical protein